MEASNRVSGTSGFGLFRLAVGGGAEEAMLLNAYAHGAISVAMTPRQRLWCLCEIGLGDDALAASLDDRRLAEAVLGHRRGAPVTA